jgi:hypothetical protein
MDRPQTGHLVQQAVCRQRKQSTDKALRTLARRSTEAGYCEGPQSVRSLYFTPDIRFRAETSSMRSLPWLQDSTETTTSRPSLKRKRGAAPSTEPADEDLPAKSVEPFDPSEPALSDSDDTTILTYNADSAFDAMIQGYDHDDAYIMVEHDLIEAAKQVTRHIHLEAYQKQATVPVVGQILRPTTGKPSHRPVVEGESGIEEMESVPDDVSPLGQLLRQRPKTAPVAATPIKRDGARCVRDTDVKTIDLNLDGSQRGEKEMNGSLQTTKNGIRKENRNMDNDVTDDDDEDLDKRPTKVQGITISLLID